MKKLSEKEINEMGDVGEDLPDKPLPEKSLPPIKSIEPDPELTELEKKDGDGVDRALEMLEEYDKE